MTMNDNDDIQGRFLGMPYDWRLPTPAKIVRRVYNPGGPLFPPKTWGVGWTLNLAHPASGWLTAGILLIGLVLSATVG